MMGCSLVDWGNATIEMIDVLSVETAKYYVESQTSEEDTEDTEDTEDETASEDLIFKESEMLY